MDNVQIEIERKFLIAFPDNNFLLSKYGGTKKEITQTYLESESRSTRRIRKVETENGTCYYFTEKRRIDALSCYENEYEITQEEYQEMLYERDKSSNDIVKTRYCIPFGNHTVEIDIYSFWADRAVMEIELKSAEEEFCLPPEIRIIKDVTNDRRYKNVSLSKTIPFDKL